jgi:hypothetical protein
MKATELFYHFAAIWGHKWVSNMQDEHIHNIALEHWQQILDELTTEQINTACAKARATLDWPPSIAQFKKLALDLLTPDAAFAEAYSGGRFSGLLDSWSWKTNTEPELRRKFYAQYDLLMQEMLGGNGSDYDLLDDMRKLT